MNRLWWGLFGVAILASSTGCRTCDSRYRLFKRDSCDVPTRLASVPRAADPCPVGVASFQPGYSMPPTSGPMFVPTVPPSSGSLETIPPTFVPATPMPAVPGGSAKNVLPPPQALTPPVGVVGYPK